MVMQTKLYQVINRRHIFAGFITGNLYLMIPYGGSQITLRLVMVNSHIYHTLYHNSHSFALTGYNRCVIMLLYDSKFAII